MSQLRPGEGYAQRRRRRQASRYRQRRKQDRLTLAGQGAERHQRVLALLLAGRLPLRRDP